MFKRKKGKIAALSLALAVGAAFTFSGCAGNPYSSTNLDKYIKVGKYKGLKTTQTVAGVTNKDIDNKISATLTKAQTKKSVKTGKVQKGDTLTIDYKGTIKGKEFDGGTASDASLKVGSGQFIDGFESGLIGEKIGSKKTLHLKFPKDYSNKKVANKKVDFKVTIKSKEQTDTPTLKEYVADKEKGKTVEEYKKAVKEGLQKDNEKAAKESTKASLWSQILATSSVKKDKKGKELYPEKQLDEATKNLKDMYRSYAKQYNVSYKKFLKQQLNMTESQFNKQAKAYAKVTVKEDECIYYIAKKEHIKVSKEEYKSYIKKTLKAYNYTEKSFEKAQNGKSYEDVVGKDNIYKQIYKNKVENLIYKNAKISIKKK